MTIGSYPQGAIWVYLKVAHDDTTGYRNKNAPLCKIGTRHLPLSGQRIENIRFSSCRNPESVIVLNITVSAIIATKTMVFQEGIIPEHALFVAIQQTQRSIAISNHQFAVYILQTADVRIQETAALRLLHIFEQVGGFVLHIIIIKTLSPHLNPHILLRIHQKFLWCPLYVDGLQPHFRLAVELLGSRVIDTISHRSMHPDLSFIVLLQFIYVIVGQ